MNSQISIPSATYRFQFHQGFTFQHARELVPYLHDLGISHVYASPFFKATPGSTHGYDVVDHNEFNPEVGSREEFEAFSAELKQRGMSLVVDFVPNHMGIAESQNRWWLDVLENGPSSPYARFFDIDWHPLKRELESKVLLPTLGEQYGRMLEKGEFQLEYRDGNFELKVYSLRLPIAPRTTRRILQPAAELLGDEVPPELASIISALDHLPPRTETDPQKIAERTREKQVIRDRLIRLCGEVPAVADAIQQAIAELNAPNSTSFDRLDALIDEQPYRLSSWKTAAEEINYRRFFDVNTLAAIRMELPEVFEAAHRLLLELIAAGHVSGVRIDHIDGLANPREYLAQLQKQAALARQLPADQNAIYLLVEKILGAGEHLRTGWPIHGTTGYEFAAEVGGVLIDRDAERMMTESYKRFIGFGLDFHEIVYRSKRLVMQVSMASEVNALGQLLNRLSESHRWYRDFTVNALTTAVREVIACFPVYRTYLVPGEPADSKDTRIIARALAAARRRNPALELTVFDFLRDVLLPPADNPHPVDEELRATFVLKFQQCTGPITAKGVEDTAFYVYNRLVALNEVGGEPATFGTAVELFHRQNATRLNDFPHSLLATSTHDTKRSEDMRARIAALSEIPQEWARAARRWHTLNLKLQREIDGEGAPDANEEYLLYQSLLGSWPLAPMNDAERATYIERIQAYLVKALHEAKVNSSWIQPNETWDQAVSEFAAAILKPGRRNRFLAAFEPLAERVAQLGAINSLSQVVLKLTVPGVPDMYQGSEMWDFSLVDPDNRRPVDYASRRDQLSALGETPAPAELLEHWRDGRIKLFITHKLLRFRREHPELFAGGSYQPIEATGKFSACCVAFRREVAGKRLLVIVPRLSSRVGFPPIGERWQDTELPLSSVGEVWRDLFTGREHAADTNLSLASILADFPVAVLTDLSPA
ncbi:MAG TPA: malto-oligosyltrehalose synthase [Chthoniobacteraceae bacterium]|nr:malto-oligosyltrehalose synthase [Chthoniobacteraceae bacterium]